MLGADAYNRAFVHGHTYQGHAAACAAALEVQQIIQEERLLDNVQDLGLLLGERLKEEIGHHPNVGDIRGRGFFWGIEFVADKETSAPFPAEAHVAMEICALGLTEKYSINVYPGSGTVDGVRGDHIIISPPYNVNRDDVELVVKTVAGLVGDYFENRSDSSHNH